jgi:hypothetical protein
MDYPPLYAGFGAGYTLCPAVGRSRTQHSVKRPDKHTTWRPIATTEV